MMVVWVNMNVVVIVVVITKTVVIMGMILKMVVMVVWVMLVVKMVMTDYEVAENIDSSGHGCDNESDMVMVTN